MPSLVEPLTGNSWYISISAYQSKESKVYICTTVEDTPKTPETKAQKPIKPLYKMMPGLDANILGSKVATVSHL